MLNHQGRIHDFGNFVKIENQKLIGKVKLCMDEIACVVGSNE
jgi:hypothetical protein